LGGYKFIHSPTKEWKAKELIEGFRMLRQIILIAEEGDVYGDTVSILFVRYN